MMLRPVFFRSLTQRAVVATAGVAIMLAAGSAMANQITLITLSKGQLALLPASWTIFNAKDRSKSVASLPRHTGTISLPAGHYHAKLEAEGQTKETEFRVESNVDKVVTLSID